MTHIILILSFVFLNFNYVNAKKVDLDSLWGVWNNKNMEDTIRLKAMHDIAWDGYLFSYPDSALYFAEMEYDLALKTDNKKFQAKALNTQGASFYIKGDFPKALEYYIPSLKLKEEIKDIRGKAGALGNIATIYEIQKEYTSAIKYNKQSLEIYKDLDDKKGIGICLNNIGIIYHKLSDINIAFDYYSESLKIQETLGNLEEIANCLENMGRILSTKNESQKAMASFNRCLKIRRELKNKQGVILTLLSIGRLYDKKGNLIKCINYGDTALIIAQEAGIIQLIKEGSSFLHLAYKKNLQFDKALQMHELNIIMKDSISSKAADKKTTVQLMKFDHERELLIKQINIEKQEFYNKLTYGISSVIILILITGSLFIYRNYKLKEKLNKELETLSIVASETENVILVLDDKGNLEWINESFIRLNNLTKEQLVSERGPNIRAISNNSEMSKILEQCKVSKKPYQYDSLNITNQGKRVWESSTITPIFNNKCILKKFIIIDTDITKQKRTEEILEEKNNDILSNINYAKKIQDALLPSEEKVRNTIPDSFTLYLPKDIVSGDFYWFHKDDKGNTYFAAADCTGHGVSGAFMSIIGLNLLDDLVVNEEMKEVDKILIKMRKHIIKHLNQTGRTGEARDGMDIALCKMNKEKVEFAGAFNPLILIRNNEIIEIKGDAQPIGFYTGHETPFTKHEIKIEKDDMLYVYSDGFQDQFGGKKGKKYMAGKFKKLLLSISHQSCQGQFESLNNEFKKWKGQNEQVDDICIIGVRA